MDDRNTLGQWKQSSGRRSQAADHPAGEIQLRAGGGLARRADLMSEANDPQNPFPTMSII